MTQNIKVFTLKTCIIGFWILICMGFLYTPRIAQFFTRKKSLSILTWTHVIDPGILQIFDEKTGIKVYLNYFENNEELLTKLRLSKENSYDIIIPSDFMVEQLIQEDMLKKLDPNRVIPILEQIKPELLCHYFDPKNEYSIPCLWDLYGLGINDNHFTKKPPASWSLIFDKNVTPGHIAMTNDPREVILLAARYLFHSIDNLEDKKLDAIESLLLQQKKWVEAYTDLRADYLLASGTSPVAVLPFSALIKTFIVHKHLSFILPTKTFILIDSFVIPKMSSKDDYIYKLINFLMDQEVVTHHFNEFKFLPTRADVLNTITVPMINLKKISWKHLDFFRNVIPFKKLHDMWRTLKAF